MTNLEPGVLSFPSSRLRGLTAFTATELRVQLHEAPSLATSMVIQVVFLVFVRLLAPPSYLPFALVGAVIFSIFTLGERVLNESAFIRLDHKLDELYHATPMTAEAYFLGISGGILFAYLPPVAFLLVVMEWVHPLNAAGAAVLAAGLVGVWAISCSLGYVISTLFRDMRAIWPYSSLLYNLFGVLPPVFYPLAYFPSVLQPIALALPASGVAALTMAATGLAPLSHGQVELAVGSLVVETLALLSFALWWARRTARED